MLRLEFFDWGGRRLCFLSTFRHTPRQAVAVNGRDGCVVLLEYAEKERLEVVGSVKAKGILLLQRVDQVGWSRG